MAEEVKQKTVDSFESIRRFISPVLIVLIGWLLSDKMNAISKQLEVIGVLQISYAQLRAVVDGTKKDIYRIEARQDKFENDGLYREAEKNIKRKIR